MENKSNQFKQWEGMEFLLLVPSHPDADDDDQIEIYAYMESAPRYEDGLVNFELYFKDVAKITRGYPRLKLPSMIFTVSVEMINLLYLGVWIKPKPSIDMVRLN